MRFVVKIKDINSLLSIISSKGYTRGQLAKQAKVSRSTVINMYDGKHVGPASVKKICVALDIDENEFDKYFIVEDARKSSRNALANAHD